MNLIVDTSDIPHMRLQFPYAYNIGNINSAPPSYPSDTKYYMQALEALTKLGYSSWKSSEQGLAVSLIMEGIKDLLVIFPTGLYKNC